MSHTMRRRSGFTLIELLLVISMLAVLAAIGAGAYFKVRNAATESATERVLQRFQLALDAQVKAVLDQAKEEASGRVPAPAGLGIVKFVAGGDPDRTQALWAYCRLKQQLPMTFAEAAGAVDPAGADTRRGIYFDFRGVPAAVAGAYSQKAPPTFLVLPASEKFQKFAGVTGTGQVEESAALLYIHLTERGSRGALTGDDVSNGSPTPFNLAGEDYTVFRDPYGGPVGFVRWAVNPTELNVPPYSATKVLTDPKDPLDPRGTLRATTWNAQLVAVVRAGLGMSGAAFENNRWVATVVSAGPNGAKEPSDPLARTRWDTLRGSFEPQPLLLPTPIEEGVTRSTPGVGASETSTNNIYGFRLRARQ